MSDAKRLAMAIMELSAATAGKEIDEAVLAVYVKRLSTLPIGEVLGAIDRLTMRSKFFPSVAEIAEAVGESDKLEAVEAWNGGHPGPVNNEVIRLLGGSHRIGQTLESEMHFVERRYLELYPLVKAKHLSGRLEQAQIAPRAGSGGLRRIGS